MSEFVVGLTVGVLVVALIVYVIGGFSKNRPKKQSGWSVNETIDRIEKEDQKVGVCVPWAEWSVTIDPRQAVELLRRFSPDTRIDVSYTGGTMFLRGKS
jgi:hypothetical protein